MKKYVKHTWNLCKDSFSFLYEGFLTNQFSVYLHAFTYVLARHIDKFRSHILDMKSKRDQFPLLQRQVKGLHDLLPCDPRFSYSILIPLNNPSPKLLKSCLISACDQTPRHCEILVGCHASLSEKCLHVIHEVDTLHPGKMRFFDFSNEDKEKPLLNLLAKQSRMNFLLFADQGDWLRPDLLFRYEQFLRTCKTPEKEIICCSENLIDERDYIVPNSDKHKSLPVFPYLFQRAFSLRGVLVPKQLWMKCHGLHPEFSGAEEEDLYLRIDLAGGVFNNIPISLYSHRKNSKESEAPFNKTALIRSLNEYTQQKGLAWNIQEGDHPLYVRPIPEITSGHKIHVIIPFKDQKELTLRCIDSVLKQEGTSYCFTCVDNGSKDKSIAEAIKHMGGEVITIDEPFNFSRLNNLAVAKTVIGKTCDLLLFLNNDVELDKDAFLEMVRWIDQPGVGIVGARLHYPDGRLQHGGIVIDSINSHDKLNFQQIEIYKSYDSLNITRSTYVPNALIGACILVKKDNFLSVKGFDEIWFPIACSDTDLAAKMARKGLKCLYTPYASGIHHESVSRSKMILEDIEYSRWMQELVSKHVHTGIASDSK